MGLTSWENAPNGKIQIFAISIAKNYLTEKEINYLNRIVTMIWTMQNYKLREKYLWQWKIGKIDWITLSNLIMKKY